MTHHHPSRLQRLAAAAVLGLACVAAPAAPLDDLRTQVEASQFEAAWATVQANPQLIGDTHFDFLYGLAAINVGRVAEGVLALERHLGAVPANDRARLELARGYFLLGEYTRARSEFEFVLRYNPPAGVRANIQGFLQAMQTRELAEGRSSARFYAELGHGRNNNVNGGTWHDTVATTIGTFVPDRLSRQISDDATQVALGGQKLVRVTGRMSVFAGFDLNHAENATWKAFNLTSGGAYIGFTQLSSLALWRVTLNASELLVGANRYRDTLGLGAEANFTPSPTVAVMAFGSHDEYRYAQPDDNRGANADSLGAMLTVSPPSWPGAPSLGARFTATREHNTRFQRDLSFDQVALRLFAAATPLDRLRISAGFTASRKKHDVASVLEPEARQETMLALDAVATYALDERWQLRADGSWSTTRANIDIYDYGRKTLTLKLRYQY
jgi:tetratricopeptide (TPR) repeat protein